MALARLLTAPNIAGVINLEAILTHNPAELATATPNWRVYVVESD